MSRHNTMIYENMRPPVASEAGETPLRGKGARQIFQLANGEFEDRSGFKITKDQVVMNYTDDGKLVDANWNSRHHVTPSLFNTKNHKHYKVSWTTSISLLVLTFTLDTAILWQRLQEQRHPDDLPLETIGPLR